MKRLSQLLLLLLVPTFAQAQVEWTEVEAPRSYKYDGVFASVGGAHGVELDKNGRVWMCGFGSANTGIYVWNQDGTPADFSPIETATVGSTTIPTKTQCRGMVEDHDGHMLVVMNSLHLVRFNVDDGTAVAIKAFDASQAKPAVDADGAVYTARVVPASGAEVTTVEVLDIETDFGALATVEVEPAILTRALNVSQDGTQLFIARESGSFNGVWHYSSDDLLTYTPADTMQFFEGNVTGLDFDANGQLWASDEGQFPDDAEFTTRSYKVLDLEAHTYWTFASDSLGLRPRGIATTANQDTLYVVNFNSGTVQRFVEGEEGTPIADADVPSQVTFAANHPNPFSGQTHFKFNLSAPATVELAVYDVLGRRVQTLLDPALRAAGPHTTAWDGTNENGRTLANGTYFFVLTVDGQRLTRPAVLLR